MIIPDETKALLDKKGVYAIVNIADGKNTTYIGSTGQKFGIRLGEHRRKLAKRIHENKRLERAWYKYGEESFRFVILETVDIPSEIAGREQFWLDFTMNHLPVYNFGTIARLPRLGAKSSEEHKRKQSLALRGRKAAGHPQSEESRKKLSTARIGMVFSEEHRRHISEAKLGKKMCPASIEKMRASQLGHPVSEETRKKISEKMVGNQRGAREYPPLVNRETGEVVQAGQNIRALARKLGLDSSSISKLIKGKLKSHYGWVLNG